MKVIAHSIAEPLSKTEEIILLDEGGATSMARDTAGTMLQSFEAIKDAVGLDIPRCCETSPPAGWLEKQLWRATACP